MRIEKDGIVLRDYQLTDIDDEIRWTNIDTAWFYEDTPWMTMTPVDPEELRADMTEIIEEMTEGGIRWRFEIEVDGRHIGMLSSYYLDDNYEHPPWDSIDQSKNAEENNAVRAIGIEICEQEYWGRGIGAKALSMFIDYYRSIGEKRFLIETWSGNKRMLGCANKLGFKEIKRIKSEYVVDGKEYDALILGYDAEVNIEGLTVSLKPMTEDMFYSYFKEYENDPDLYFEGQEYTPYEYSEEKVAKYIQRQKDLNRVILAIMCDDEIVGEIIIKNIEEGKCATMGLALKNAAYKDHGIGTEAERLAIQYVFNELDIPTLYADAIKTNTRSQHVMEKIGFVLTSEDDNFKYYRIDRE